MHKLGVIGAGNMASAIVRGVLRRGGLRPSDIAVSDKDKSKLDFFRSEGCFVTDDNTAVLSSSDFILLAVKPQILAEVLDELSPLSAGKNFLSIVAGWTVERISQRLASSAVVLRAMPNTPLLVGKGATVLADSTQKSAVEFASGLFEGVAEFLPEEKMDAVTAVNGSGPAYFFRMAGVMVAHAVERGIDEKTALRLVAMTMEGAAAMLAQTDLAPQELVRQVSSPGGATIAALSAFDDMKWDDAIKEAMRRCEMRSSELGR